MWDLPNPSLARRGCLKVPPFIRGVPKSPPLYKGGIKGGRGLRVGER